MKVFTCLQACRVRILGGIASQSLKFIGRTHEVVEGVLSPKASTFSQHFIDPSRRETLPGLALREHGLLIHKCRQDVDIIGITTESQRL